jgi:hypothetical protein
VHGTEHNVKAIVERAKRSGGVQGSIAVEVGLHRSGRIFPWEVLFKECSVQGTYHPGVFWSKDVKSLNKYPLIHRSGTSWHPVSWLFEMICRSINFWETKIMSIQNTVHIRICCSKFREMPKSQANSHRSLCFSDALLETKVPVNKHSYYIYLNADKKEVIGYNF